MVLRAARAGGRVHANRRRTSQPRRPDASPALDGRRPRPRRMPPPGRRGHLSVLSPESLRKRVCAAPGARPEANGVSREFNLVVDRIKCDGRGLCAELLPELIRLDDWGYPILRPGPLPEHLLPLAQRVVEDCPVLAIALRRTERRK